MKRDDVLRLYDGDFAASYDATFHRGECGACSEHEIEIVRRLLAETGEWLDVGCGTGYVLSRFPGIRRAGIDISPAMLEKARQANSDVLFLRECNFLDDIPEWHDRWDLVTCMWFAYTLLESLTELEALITNLARWTSRSGACFFPICDPLRLAPGITLPERGAAPSHGGNVIITGVTWNWIEPSGREHPNMIAPTVEHLAALFRQSFDEVAIVEYPDREAIVAKSKKSTEAQPTGT